MYSRWVRELILLVKYSVHFATAFHILLQNVNAYSKTSLHKNVAIYAFVKQMDIADLPNHSSQWTLGQEYTPVYNILLLLPAAASHFS